MGITTSAPKRQTDALAGSAELAGQRPSSDLIGKESVKDMMIEIDRQIGYVEHASETLRETLEGLRQARRALAKLSSSPSDADVPDDFAARKRERKGSRAWTVRKWAYRILKEEGRPLTASELTERLHKAGVNLGEARRVQIVTKIMWAAKEFSHTDLGYWFAESPPSARESAVRS